MQFRKLAPYIYKYLMMLIMGTCRVKKYGKEHIDHLESKGQAWIYGIWHNNALISVWVLRSQETIAMVSNSKDGEIIAKAIEILDGTVIRGSTSKGSMQAAQKALRALKQDKVLAITPDGPRGPKYTLQEGVLYLSALTNTPIIPLHIECSRQWEFNSWDRLKLPKPFSQIHVSLGNPVTVLSDEVANEKNKELARQRIETVMMENVEKVRKMAKHIQA